MSKTRATSDSYGSLSLRQIRNLIRDQRVQSEAVNERIRVRRQLLTRASDSVPDNLTGTFVPPPFDQSKVIIKTMIGEVAKAQQHYAARISANTPKVSVEPQTTNKKISATVEKHSGGQERLDMTLWEKMGGRPKQWVMGMHMTSGGVGYYHVMPRDADFGLPDREYYEDSDEQLALLRDAGKLSTGKVVRPSGQLVYAEHDDVWAARRKNSARYRAESGDSLFTLEALPRDQVLVWYDRDGIKAAAIIEVIPSDECEPGSPLAESYARTRGVEDEDVPKYGIWLDKNGKVVGGIETGAPPDEGWQRPKSFTLIRFFNRVEQCVLVAGMNSVDGADEVFRGRHGARNGAQAVCPIVEVPMMRTGINVPGQEFTTPMEPVYAYAPIINQFMTLLSQAATYNLLPRWAVQLKDGSTLRGEDGEPVIVDNGPAPGLDPSEAAAYPGELIQLLIKTESMEKLYQHFKDALEACMPAPVLTGVSGSSAAAWQVRQLIQQGQETLRQAVDNHAAAVKEVLQMCHGWMRQLDVPVYFFPAPGERSDRRTQRSLVEFDPKDITDSISVVQELDTPDEATVLVQQGIELHQAGFIDDEEFYEKYAREQDVRDAVKRKAKRQVKEYLWTGALPPLPPGAQPQELPMVKVIGDAVRGRVFYELIANAPHFADQVARDMAMQAQQQMSGMGAGVPGMGQDMGGLAGGIPPGGMAGMQQQAPMGGDVAGAAGMSQPGMGQATTLQGQLGGNVPGGMAPPPVAGG